MAPLAGQDTAHKKNITYKTLFLKNRKDGAGILGGGKGNTYDATRKKNC